MKFLNKTSPLEKVFVYETLLDKMLRDKVIHKGVLSKVDIVPDYYVMRKEFITFPKGD